MDDVILDEAKHLANGMFKKTCVEFDDHKIFSSRRRSKSVSSFCNNETKSHPKPRFVLSSDSDDDDNFDLKQTTKQPVNEEDSSTSDEEDSDDELEAYLPLARRLEMMKANEKPASNHTGEESIRINLAVKDEEDVVSTKYKYCSEARLSTNADVKCRERRPSSNVNPAETRSLKTSQSDETDSLKTYELNETGSSSELNDSLETSELNEPGCLMKSESNESRRSTNGGLNETLSRVDEIGSLKTNELIQSGRLKTSEFDETGSLKTRALDGNRSFKTSVLDDSTCDMFSIDISFDYVDNKRELSRETNDPQCDGVGINQMKSFVI